MPEPTIVTVILNTNRRDDTLQCLESLMRSRYTNHQAVVLDNHSTDGSVEAICEQFPQARVISLEENLGYAGNNNVGIQAALQMGADWVFVLNEDTILDPECLPRLAEVGQSSPDIGIVGPMVYHFDEPAVIQSAGGMLSSSWSAVHRGQNETDHGQFAQPQDVEWISGCAILVKRETIEQVGMLDARFFYYWEETEWCVRSRKGGWRVVHAPSAKIWHKGVQRDYRPVPNVTYYATRNRFLLLAKHQAALSVWIKVWFSTLRTLVSWTVKPKWANMRLHRDAMWQGLTDFLRGKYGMRSGNLR